MTARDLIKLLQGLGDNNLDREVVMFDGPTYFTPYRVKIAEEDFGCKIKGKVLID